MRDAHDKALDGSSGVDWQELARRYEGLLEKSQNIFNPQAIQARLSYSLEC